ncbi:hypothetical protein Tco_0027053, partial [Tanacetum coccineum]
MDITRAQQIACMTLVASPNNCKIGKKESLDYASDLKAKEQLSKNCIQICPKLPNQQFEEPPFEEAFLRDLVISKCLSGKSTEYDSLRLSQAQILWGMYHKKNVDYAYLMWDDFVYQVENKNVKRSNEMYYPRFTKVIVNFFMTKDSSIPRRNKVNWHFARDDPMFTTIKVVSRHEDTHLYGAILLDELTNEAIKDSESYKEYYAITLGAETPKTKTSVKKKQDASDTTKTPSTAKGKRLKTSAKAAKPAKKQPANTSKAKSLTMLSKVALTKAEQMKLAIKRRVPDVPTYNSDDEQISWKSSDEEDDDDQEHDNQDDDDQEHDNQDNDDQEHDGQDDEEQDDVNEQTDSDNDGDDFVHPKFYTHNEEDSFDPRVQTHSHVESTDDEDSDEEIQGTNVEEEELDEEETNEEDEANELYRDMNVNLEGRDTEMTDAPRTIIQTTQVIEDTHVIITLVNPEGQQQSSSVSSGFVSNMLNPSPDTGIDFIFNPNTESTSLVDVLVTTIAKPPLLSAIILPPPPTPLITHLQQTPVPTPATVPSSSLQDLPNFGSLFGFDHRLKTLETNFSEFKQTNQFDAVVSSIPSFVDAYLANKMHEAVKTATVNEQLEVEVLTRSSNESKTSHAVAANLSELELKKILIDKMESNKSIHKYDEQKNIYKALVDAYESDKLILDTYGDTVSFKRRRDDEDKDKEPSAGSNRGSKRRRAGKEPESTSAPKEKTSKTIGKSTEWSKSHHKSADKSAQDTKDKPDEETSQHPDWFQKLAKPPTPDRDWNTTLPAAHGPVQPWLSTLAQREDTPGPTFKLMKGSCKSLVELEYFLKEFYKATTNQLDWNNPEGQQYPHDLRKPLPLTPNSRGRQVIPFDHFINNNLAYLSGGVSSRTYTTSVT